MFFAFIYHNNAVANKWLGRSHVLSNETKVVLVTDEKGLFRKHKVELWGSCRRCVLAHTNQNSDLKRGICRFFPSEKDCTSPPHNNDSRRCSVNATETFAHAPRPDPRDSDKLTEAAREVPRFCNGVATTLTAYVKSYMRNRLVQKWITLTIV